MNQSSASHSSLVAPLRIAARPFIQALGLLGALATILLLLSPSRTSAIEVCWDYAIYRLTGNDPRPKGSAPWGGKMTDLTALHRVLGEKGYTLVQPRPSAQELRPDDVIITGNHVGYVNARDAIDHYLQVLGETVQRPEFSERPTHPVDKLPAASTKEKGGYYEGDSLQTFLKRPHTPAGTYEVWRKVPNIWGLVEVITDPGRYTQSFSRKGPNFEHVEQFKANSYVMDHKDWHDNARTKKGQTYRIDVTMESPPARIMPRGDFTLKVSGTCTKQVMTDWVRRFGAYEVTGGIDVKLASAHFTPGKPTYKGQPFVGNDDAGGFVSQATAEYKFTVPAAMSDEFIIEQKGLAIFKYKRGATPIALPK